MADEQFTGAVEYRRMAGGVKFGSKAFYVKVATQDSRLAMAEIIKRYQDVIKRLRDVTPQALGEALTPTFKLAQYYVPEDTGALWESGKITTGKTKAGKSAASITFGNAEAWYAAIVHEYTWLAHQEPTRSKYLQAAMEETIDGMIMSLGKTYKQLLT